MIIFQGKTHNPSDIELTAVNSHMALSAGAGAAFAIPAGPDEELVLVQEVHQPGLSESEISAIFHSIRQSILRDHGLSFHTIALVQPGAVAKTPQGKIQRMATRQKFLSAALETIALEKPDKAPANQEENSLFRWNHPSKKGRIALAFGNNTLSFEELEEKAAAISAWLHNAGSTAVKRAGIYISHCPESIIGLLGIIQAGATAVWLNAADADPAENPLWTEEGLLKFLPHRQVPVALPESAKHLVYINDLHPDAPAGSVEIQNAAGNDILEAPGVYQPLTAAKLPARFGELDAMAGPDGRGYCMVEEKQFSVHSLTAILWAISRGYTVCFHALSPVNEHGLPGRTKEMDFSLFYFSSDSNAVAGNKYELVLEGARYADQHHFKAVWIPERHFHAFGGLYPNPSVVCSALAMITQRIRLRAGSVVISLQNSIRVAEEWSVVDNLSNGRVDIGFARGWNPNDFVLSPESYSNNRQILFERMAEVKTLWKGESITRKNGVDKDTSFRIFPMPVQKNLNSWVTCSGGEERFMEAGASGANILTALLFQSTESLAEKIAKYKEARRQNGHDPETGIVTLMLHTYIGDDPAAVKEDVRQPFIEYLRSSVDLWRTESADLEEISGADQDKLLSFAFERYFRTSALFGTPESCLATIQHLKEIGVDEIACLIDFGVDTDKTLASLKHLNDLRKLALADALKKTPVFNINQENSGNPDRFIVLGDAEAEARYLDIFGEKKVSLVFLGSGTE